MEMHVAAHYALEMCGHMQIRAGALIHGNKWRYTLGRRVQLHAQLFDAC